MELLLILNNFNNVNKTSFREGGGGERPENFRMCSDLCYYHVPYMAGLVNSQGLCFPSLVQPMHAAQSYWVIYQSAPLILQAKTRS